MIATRASRTLALLLGGLALLLAGCGGPKGPKITGSVTLDGYPLTHARLDFESVDDNLQSGNFAETDEAGRFEIKPHPTIRWTLKPGTYRVYVTKWVDRAGNVPPKGEDGGTADMDGQLFNRVPARYSDREDEGTILTVEIKSGDNDIPIRLTSPR